MVFFIFLVAVVNLGLGFVVATIVKRRYQELVTLASDAADSTMPSIWPEWQTSPAEERPGSSTSAPSPSEDSAAGNADPGPPSDSPPDVAALLGDVSFHEPSDEGRPAEESAGSEIDGEEAARLDEPCESPRDSNEASDAEGVEADAEPQEVAGEACEAFQSLFAEIQGINSDADGP
ncbi:MAG: hypothetical protein ACYTG0_15485 [Planctomycetota bacterium]